MLKTVPQDVLLSLPLVKRFLLMDEDKTAAINEQLLDDEEGLDERGDGNGSREPELHGLLVESDTFTSVDSAFDASDTDQ
jgi:hypothetical protein